MKKTVITTAIIVVTALAALLSFIGLNQGKNADELNFTEVRRGSFEISVSNTGEIIAEHSIDIKGPDIVRNSNFRVAPVRVIDLVPEGTLVRKGDYVAALDKSNFDNTLKDEVTALKKAEAEIEMKLLDTAVVLSTLRDDIRNQIFAVVEAEINLEQSKYDPPAAQRQAEMELDRLQRYLEQKRRTYFLRLAQTSSETRNMRMALNRQRKKVKDIGEILAGFTVTAPSDGMVVYKKDRMGIRIKSGSMINPFDPVVASLPDLNSLISKTYISETDVSKIKEGLQAEVVVDAFQGKSYKGLVTSIANIGEQITNSDSKVFEVLVRISEPYTLLKPMMTTSNKVIIKQYDDVIFVPVESVQTGSDNIPYVYTKSGYKQPVLLGESNENDIIVEKGLSEGTDVWLTIPQDHEKYTLASNELIPLIIEREMIKKSSNRKLIKDSDFIAESQAGSDSLKSSVPLRD